MQEKLEMFDYEVEKYEGMSGGTLSNDIKVAVRLKAILHGERFQQRESSGSHGDRWPDHENMGRH